MRKQLISYLPDVLLKTCEFPLLCLAEQPEFDGFLSAAENVLDSQFIMTAPEAAIDRYERIFGIVARDTESLDDRRFQILAKINEQLPYTIRRLRVLLDSFCGAENYSVDVDHAHYILSVQFNLSAKSNFGDELLERMVPANMQIRIVLMTPASHLYTGFFSHEITSHTYKMASQPDMSVHDSQIYSGFTVRQGTIHKYIMRGGGEIV